MSEIQRYQITERHLFEQAADGPFCLYLDARWYQRQYWMSLVINIVAVLVCGILAALLVHEKAARSPVEVPVGAAEKLGLLSDIEAMKKSRDDYKALALNYKAQIKSLTTKIDGHVAQLDALQARGKELDTLNREQAQRMSTNQGVVLEAKRVLGVNVKVVE